MAKKCCKNELSWKKNEKNEKYSKLTSFFGLEVWPEGQFRGQVPYPEVSKSLGLRGGQKWPKNAVEMNYHENQIKKMKRIIS